MVVLVVMVIGIVVGVVIGIDACVLVLHKPKDAWRRWCLVVLVGGFWAK